MLKTLLIIDDSAPVRQQVRLALETPDLCVLEAVSAEKALDMVRTQKIDIMITDVNMGGMSGLEFLRTVRKLPGHATTPVFVLTTEASQSMLQHGREAGATAWIVKPFRPDALRRGVQKVLGMAPA